LRNLNRAYVMSRKDSVLEPKSAILIVEDDVNLASNLQDVLEKEGYSAAVAYDGEAALTLCAEQVFDLALIDIKLPDVQGVDLVEKLAELSPVTEYIIITAYPSLETAVAGIGQNGIIGYETKPLDMGRLISLIRQFTERKRAEDQLRLEAQLLDCVTDSIFLHDFEGNCFYVNESAYKSRGYSRDELIGMNLHALDSPKYSRTIQKQGRDLMKRGQAAFESAHVRKDQSIMPVEVQARIVESGGRKLILSVARDITERKRGQEKLQQSYRKLQRTMEGTTLAFELATEMRDPYTSGHQRRATRLACAIAREMGVCKERIEGIHMAGSIHDVGKMYVPSEILARPAPLTEAEFSLIKVHPKAGHDILRAAEAAWPIAQIVLQHHERMDGSGYPSGLSGGDILLEARILAVADVVEAMSSHRPYRPAYPIDKALLQIMQKKDVLYDCNAVDACLSLFTEKGFKFD